MSCSFFEILVTFQLIIVLFPSDLGMTEIAKVLLLIWVKFLISSVYLRVKIPWGDIALTKTLKGPSNFFTVEITEVKVSSEVSSSGITGMTKTGLACS
jgi:hypothetical protein